MAYVVFENNGEMDTRFIKTFGVSAKEVDNPIGFFGTGLKYALAIFMREGVDVNLVSGLESYHFEKSLLNMRGTDFQVIKMIGETSSEELPFTTHLGRNWQTWQAFREIYCNCIDEKGKVYLSDTFPEPQAQKTYFVLSGREALDLYKEKNSIVLNLPISLMTESNGVEIYKQSSNYIYYRGIRVAPLDKPSLYTYNIKKELGLTEDRTLMSIHSAMSYITRSIAGLTDSDMLKRILTAEDVWIERDFSFSNLIYFNEDCSDVFYEIIEREFKNNNERLNDSVKDIHRHRVKNNASRHYEPIKLTAVQQKALDRSVKIISGLWPEFNDYKILTVKTLGQSTMALADANEQTMVVSVRCFDLGTKFLVSTLIEEFFHLKTGFGDMTRPLQTYLFDTICSLIESHVIEEPI